MNNTVTLQLITDQRHKMLQDEGKDFEIKYRMLQLEIKKKVDIIVNNFKE
jgi:frataxin-like iron-binding protein CyaY